MVGDALAAATRERKGIPHHRSDVLGHRVAQQPAGAMEARLHRLGHDTEQLGGFLDAHAFDQPRDQHGAERFGELVDGALEQRAQLALRHRGFRVELRIGVGKRNDLGFAGAAIDDRAQRNGRAPSAQAAERLVHDDPGEPSAEPRLAAEHRQAGERARIGFLQDVLGLGGIAHDAARDAVETLIVLADDAPDRGRVAVAGARDKVGFIGCERSGLLDHAGLL